jgi:hypothetical protein
VIKPGQPWGRPTVGPAAATGGGDDADLAALVRGHRGARVQFHPDPRCDLARAVGLTGASTGAVELDVDAIALDAAGLAVNAVVLGVAPDRLAAWHRRHPVTVHVDGRAVFDGAATTVVVANGQFLRGADVVPRGHPGDGRLEVQVYALRAGERRAMRRRLPGGAHLPHPRIVTSTGRRVEVRWRHPRPLEVDGRGRPPRSTLTATVEPGAYVLLV